MFPLGVAKKLPVVIYGPIKITDLSGDVIIEAPIKTGMIGIGQSYEKNKANCGLTEINVKGKLVFKDYCQLGKDVFLFVGAKATCKFGDMSSVASKGKIICTNRIELGDYARLGSECQIIDTNFHEMIDLETGENIPMTQPIEIGDFNFISNRVTIMKGTKTSTNTSIASNTLCTKDYTNLGSNVLLGGIPAKLLKRNIRRNWEGEQQRMDKNLKIKNF
ncbi:transferase [Tamlana sp. 62-3]|uniref:Transferase n=2 Tax=Neotamlana sargassicola TaxID=2883125 RepID=A0A9X1L7I0_9FLAO|nr:transferase [Tamlana sargassicola]